MIVCLDCAATIRKGPYRQRRVLRHLRRPYHDHPAATAMSEHEYVTWMRNAGRYRAAGIVGAV
jgi:hypothetical protein